MTTENPWKVDSVQAFSYLKCPECIFDSKEEDAFQDHAVENHPLSLALFGKSFKVEEFEEDPIENCMIKDDTQYENQNCEKSDSDLYENLEDINKSEGLNEDAEEFTIKV